MNGWRTFHIPRTVKRNTSKEFKRCDSLKIERKNQEQVINCEENFLDVIKNG